MQSIIPTLGICHRTRTLGTESVLRHAPCRWRAREALLLLCRDLGSWTAQQSFHPAELIIHGVRDGARVDPSVEKEVLLHRQSMVFRVSLNTPPRARRLSSHSVCSGTIATEWWINAWNHVTCWCKTSRNFESRSDSEILLEERDTVEVTASIVVTDVVPLFYKVFRPKMQSEKHCTSQFDESRPEVSVTHLNIIPYYTLWSSIFYFVML